MEKISKIYLGLFFLSLFAFLIAYLEIVGSFFVFVLLVTTFIKGYFVSDFFMDLSEVELKHRIIPTAWLATVLSLVAIAYY